MKRLFLTGIAIVITGIAACSPVVNQGSDPPSGNIMGEMIEQDAQLREKMEARKAREALAAQAAHAQKTQRVKAQLQLREQKAREAQKKLSDARQNGRLVSKSVSDDRVILTYQNNNIYTRITTNENGKVIDIHEYTLYDDDSVPK